MLKTETHNKYDKKKKSALHIEKNAAKLFSSCTTTEQQVTNKIKNIKKYLLS
jgi:hypothetical protein